MMPLLYTPAMRITPQLKRPEYSVTVVLAEY